MPEEGINPVDFPKEVEHLWGWFLQLNDKRPQAMSGAAPIAESELGWYFYNRGLSPECWEFDAINRLDAVAMAASTKEQ